MSKIIEKNSCFSKSDEFEVMSLWFMKRLVKYFGNRYHITIGFRIYLYLCSVPCDGISKIRIVNNSGYD